MAKIFNRASTNDNLLILGTRESATQPFNAPGWMDLRVGAFYSVCSAANDDPANPISGLAETITTTPFQPADWMWLGVKDPGDNLPGEGTQQFIGWSNSMWNHLGNSLLVSSDIGIGTTNAYYYRPKNSQGAAGGPGDVTSFYIYDNNQIRGIGLDGIQSHFVQDYANAGGYSGMLGFRLTRPSASSRIVTIQVPHVSTHSADMFWTNTPTQAQLLALLDPWPTLVQTLGPVSFSAVPDSLFAYWPFHNSRLRISAWGVLRAA